MPLIITVSIIECLSEIIAHANRYTNGIKSAQKKKGTNLCNQMMLQLDINESSAVYIWRIG